MPSCRIRWGYFSPSCFHITCKVTCQNKYFTTPPFCKTSYMPYLVILFSTLQKYKRWPKSHCHGIHGSFPLWEWSTTLQQVLQKILALPGCFHCPSTPSPERDFPRASWTQLMCPWNLTNSHSQALVPACQENGALFLTLLIFKCRLL